MSMQEGFNQGPDSVVMGETIIRPHHTAIIAAVLRGELELGEIADVTQTNARQQANTFGQSHPRRQEYRDRYGDEPQFASSFNAGMTTFIKEFI
ncbi:MAG TPA: hypothetical protein VD735_00525, partial [Candidatus Saccharimonadales bacterium]|nr:hypothetical protein [Candidatus Saccharimonadales bacterium]